MITLRTLWILPLLFISIVTTAQDNIKTISLQKGQILDILLITQKPDTQDKMADYGKTAFPVAMGMSYEPQFGYAIQETTSGNIQPTVLAFGKWGSLDKREQFLKDITTVVPDFHQRRKDIWSMFYLAYFEAKEDLKIDLDKNKFRVATAIWTDSKKKRKEFLKQWERAIQTSKGDDILSMAEGISPKGYRYAPDQLIITQWENKAAYEAFKKKGLNIDSKLVSDMHQFILN